MPDSAKGLQMAEEPEVRSRRPLKTRQARWAGALSRLLLRAGVKPDAVSLASVGFAAVAGVCFVAVPRACCPLAWWLLWAGAAAGIQLRLLCNLMDGMLAVEGRLKSPVGDLYNEVPDRLGDILILAGAGLGAAQWHPWAVHAGWGAVAVALLTANVRTLGASLTGSHDFRGPMGKQHRMALMTVACLAAPVEHALTGNPPLSLTVALLIVAAGGLWTAWRRLRGIARILNSRGA